MAENLMEKIVSLAKRRGFIFPSSEIYGGLSGFWDFGPLGVELKNNIKNLWWQEIVQKRDNIVGIDSAIILNSQVLKASLHTEKFADLLTDCKKCKKRFRADHLIENYFSNQNLPEEDGVAYLENLEKINKALLEIKCPLCGGELTAARPFNLMFKTYVGPQEDDSALTYLRPETCQGVFINFKNISGSLRLKIPFGIAQIGKAFRNEITVGNFIFRVREFEQAELEYFVKSKEAEKWLNFWKKERFNWFLKLGIKKENLHLKKHQKGELAHYAKEAWDIEYHFPFGFKEIEGIANRTDFDLKNHSKCSGEDLRYFDEIKRKKYFPYIIEPSLGIERAFLAILTDAFSEDKAPDEHGTLQKRTVLRLAPALSPVKIAVFPLLKKKELIKIAKEIFNQIKEDFSAQYDEIGSVGRRYRRQDEIGTPFCVTVDFETLKDKAVTVRNRDTLKQDRIKIKDLDKYLKEMLNRKMLV